MALREYTVLLLLFWGSWALTCVNCDSSFHNKKGCTLGGNKVASLPLKRFVWNVARVRPRGRAGLHVRVVWKGFSRRRNNLGWGKFFTCLLTFPRESAQFNILCCHILRSLSTSGVCFEDSRKSCVLSRSCERNKTAMKRLAMKCLMSLLRRPRDSRLKGIYTLLLAMHASPVLRDVRPTFQRGLFSFAVSFSFHSPINDWHTVCHAADEDLGCLHCRCRNVPRMIPSVS